MENIKKKNSTEKFSTKRSAQGKQVTIEGFANKAVVDRAGDLIPGNAWDLKNFEKNPIIFFNHNKDIPIGKATAFEASDDGLKMKVAISKSEAPPVPFIRDMISEGILRTFSVGFDDKGSAEKDADGINVIKSAELFETSVVTLPMNTDSEFDLSKAAVNWIVKDMSYHEAASEIVAKVKGCPIAGLLHHGLAMAQTKYGEDEYQETELKEKWAAASGLTIDKLNDILAGEETGAKELIKTFEDVYGIELKKKPKDDDDEDRYKTEKNAFQTCVSEKIPKLIDEGKSQEEAIAIAISMCQKEYKDYKVGSEDYKLFIEIAESKQAEQQETEDQPTVPLDSKTDETDFGSPAIELQKSQIALTGSMLTVMKEMLQEIRDMNAKIGDISQAKQSQDESEAKEGSDRNEETDDEEDQEKNLDGWNQKLISFQQRLETIKTNLT